MKVVIKTRCKYVRNMISTLEDVTTEARSIKDTVIFDLDNVEGIEIRE